MNALYQRLRKHANGLVLWPLFIVILVFNILLLKPGFHDEDNPDIYVEIMDVKPFYNADIVYGQFDKATPSIIQQIRWGLTYDFLYIFTYFFFWSILLIKLYDNGKYGNWLPSILWVVLILALSDIVETYLEYTIVDNLPDHLTGMANAMAYFTATKWVMTLVLIALLLFGATTKLMAKKPA